MTLPTQPGPRAGPGGPWNGQPPSGRHPARIPLPLALAYVAGYLLLDWVSYIHPLQGLNITPWNPQPAIAVALLIRNRRWLWLVWATLMGAELVIRGIPPSWPAMALSSAALSLGYAAIAQAMATRLDLSRVLATSRDLLAFALIVAAGALLCGVVYVGALALGGVGPKGALAGAVVRYWVGDAVGLLVLLPVLLMVGDADRRASLLRALRGAEWWAVAAVVAAIAWFVLGRTELDQFKYFYLLFLPVGWAAARLGAAGAVLTAALTQLCLIGAVQLLDHPEITVFELQGLMAAVAGMGLLLGVAVDERERVAAELRGSLKMAAAGEMAAAIAHELNQPLTALSSYAQACQLIADDLMRQHPGMRAQLADVTRRMVADARRASDVVKRLRDFFRSGSTHLQATDIAPMLRDLRERHERRANAVGVTISVECADDLPQVWVDAVQIAVVLRNLVGNAIDAASQAQAPGLVRVVAAVEADALRVDVLDSGPGLDRFDLQRPFDPQQSSKPAGMGIGLSISRAIVEAHGGRLWAQAGPGGRFCMALPLHADPMEEGADAS